MNRIIGSIFNLNGLAVQSHSFQKFLPIGKPEVLAEFLCRWKVDEIVNINLFNNMNKKINFNSIKKISQKINVPLAVGGGIKKMRDVETLFKNGCDKIVVSTIIFKNLKLLKQISELYGAQSIIACLDYRYCKNNLKLFINSGQEEIKIEFYECIELLDKMGIGEIILHNINKDGSRTGYDRKVLKKVNSITKLPIIGLGGFNSMSDFKNLFEEEGISLAIANSISFKEQSIYNLKKDLKKYYKINVRF